MPHFFHQIADAIAPRHRKTIFFRELVPPGYYYPRHLFKNVVDEADVERRMRDYQARVACRFHT